MKSTSNDSKSSQNSESNHNAEYIINIRNKFLRAVACANFLKFASPFIIAISLLVLFSINKHYPGSYLLLIPGITWSTTLVLFFLTVPRFNKMLKVIKASNFSIDDVTSELENTVFLDRRCLFGYTPHFLIIKKTIVIPFKNIHEVLCIYNSIASCFSIHADANKKSLICINVSVLHSLHSHKEYDEFVRCCKINQHKLPDCFKVEITYDEVAD